MACFLKRLRNFILRTPSPLRFPTTGFSVFDHSHVVEEEQFEEFKQGRFYPVSIGDVLNQKFQVVGKLGFGTTSTVWLACDLPVRNLGPDA